MTLKTTLALCGVLTTGLTMANAATAQPSASEIASYAQALMERNYAADGPGGVILVARGDEVLFRGARGEADMGVDVPLRPDSVFRIGSITKQFVAAALLTLVEVGRVSLDDPLSHYLPDYPGGDRITLLQLLNHTAGVRDYTRIPTFIEGVEEDLTTEQLIDRFEDQTPDFEPGERWAYSNSNYVLIGAVIEAVTGQPWHEYLREALFEPLGMAHTGYGHDPRLLAQQVNGYSYHEGHVVPLHPMSMTQPHAAGALLSNADDLLTWNRALHEGRVLRDDTYARMITPVGEAAGPAARYGLGIVRGPLRSTEELAHGGAIFGFGSSLSYVPGPDITVVVLENDDASNPVDDTDHIARRLAALALGDPYPAATPVSIDPAELTAAEGVYRFDADTARVLRVSDGVLTAQRGSGPQLPLTPISRDDFLYEDGFTRLTLERTPDGAIAGVRFFPNGDGDGQFGQRTTEVLPTASAGLALPLIQLERLAGVYEAGGLTLTVFLNGDALRAQLVGQDSVSLIATSPTTFDVGEEDAVVEFSPGPGPSTSVTIRQGGREMVMNRAG